MAGGVRRALGGLAPMALGHAVSVALVVPAVLWRVPLDRDMLLAVAIGLLAIAVAVHRAGRLQGQARHAGMAFGCFALSTSHGAGLALVPALLPLCIGGGVQGHGPTAELLLPTLGALAIHAVAMLAITGLAAAVAGRTWQALGRFATPSPTPIRHPG